MNRLGPFTTLQTEALDHDVLLVTLDRPHERNAVDRTMHEELLTLLFQLREEPDLGAVVLTGQGDAFCAGGSMGFFDELLDDDPRRTTRTLEQGTTLVRELLGLRPPIVAAVNGPAMGLGATLALLCDLVVMADDAVIADTHVAVGVVAGDGGTVVWPARLGLARAKEFLLTGDAVDGELAERLGLVNRVVPRDEVLTAAIALATRLADGARPAIAFTKQALNSQLQRTAAEQMPLAIALEARTFLQPDVREGRAAFAERRAPRWPSHQPEGAA